MKYQKGTFITVPNLHTLTGMDPQSQVIFMWLCKYANAYGECHPSAETLRKRTGMARSTLFARLEKLEDKGLIKRIGRVKEKGDQDTNLYQIMITEMEGGSTGDGLGVGRETDGGSTPDGHRTQSTKLNPVQGQGNAKSVSDLKRKEWKPEDKMLLPDFVKWCKASPNKHVKVIAEWAEAEGPYYETYAQWSAYIRRHTKTARRLTPFTLKQIEEAYERMLKDVKGPKNPGGFMTTYTLETLEKYLHKAQ